MLPQAHLLLLDTRRVLRHSRKTKACLQVLELFCAISAVLLLSGVSYAVGHVML
jgi:hypothetical protein